MSDGNYAAGSVPNETYSADSGKVDAAKHEAAELKDTATDAAKNVAGTAKDEAVSVAQETKAQAKDLLDQTRRELGDQAATQQERIATGLSALGDELGSMARNSENTGIASDLVQKVSDRLSGAASWLGSRDPSGVLEDVRSFARRRPAAFIGASLLAGVVVGRLTRALAANAKDQAAVESSASDRTPQLTVGAAPVSTETSGSWDESPVYAQSAARLRGTGQEVSGERSDSF